MTPAPAGAAWGRAEGSHARAREMTCRTADLTCAGHLGGKDMPEKHGVCNILASGKITAWAWAAKIITYFESND